MGVLRKQFKKLDLNLREILASILFILTISKIKITFLIKKQSHLLAIIHNFLPKNLHISLLFHQTIQIVLGLFLVIFPLFGFN